MRFHPVNLQFRIPVGVLACPVFYRVTTLDGERKHKSQAFYNDDTLKKYYFFIVVNSRMGSRVFGYRTHFLFSIEKVAKSLVSSQIQFRVSLPSTTTLTINYINYYSITIIATDNK